MKRYHLVLMLIVVPWVVTAQKNAYDSAAINVMDKMGSIIGDLKSVAFDYTSSWDYLGYDFQLFKAHGTSHVFLQGPDKLYIESRRTDKKHRGFWYNGQKFVYYSYAENNYAVMDAPPTTIATIDTIHKQYGLDFPGSDFFYPTFTDDMIDRFDKIVYLGKETTEGTECYHIMAYNDKMTVHLWISAERLILPVRFLIYYKQKPGQPHYEAVFSNWLINPVFPLTLFDFVPPPGAKKIKILPLEKQLKK